MPTTMPIGGDFAVDITSIGSVVLLTLTLTQLVKRSVMLDKVPTLIYVAAFALGLTYLGNRVFGTLPADGGFWLLAWRAVLNALLAVGAFEGGRNLLGRFGTAGGAAVLALCLLMPGCAVAPKEPARVMQNAWIVTFDLLCDGRDLGVISKDDFNAKIVPAATVSRAAVRAAIAAEERGDADGVARAQGAFKAAIEALEPYVAKARAAKASTQRAGVDLATVLLVLTALSRLVEQFTGIAKKLNAGEPLTDEEKAVLDREEQRVADRLKQEET